MLSNFAETDDPSTYRLDAAASLRAAVIAERFREQCLRRLADAPATVSRPELHADRRGPTTDTGIDPAVAAIAEWRAARHDYQAHRREIGPRLNSVPEWVRNWNGVYAGRTERAGGEVVPVLARTEGELNDGYDRRIRDAGTPEAVARLEKRRREALAELRLTLAAEKGAYRAAGLPFDGEREDAYWRGYRDRIVRAETAVETTPARSARGIEARCRHAATLIDGLDDGGAETDVARHLRGVIHRIESDVREIAAA